MANKKKLTKPKAPSAYKSTAKAPAAFVPGTYTSQYSDQLSGALDTVTNWNYDPMQDANYQALAKVYAARGNTAAKNSLADAAALNGGYGTSYAVSAAQQARNQYNQELAALVPELEANAYNRATTTLNALRDADDTAYGRFRDTESDRQWNWTNQYQQYRDKESDNQWAWTNRYNAYRDKMSDYQWAKEYALSKKGSSGGGGGRRSSGGGGGGYSAGGSSGGADLSSLWNKANSGTKYTNAWELRGNTGTVKTNKTTGTKKTTNSNTKKTTYKPSQTTRLIKR